MCRPGQICGDPCLLNCGSPGCLLICGCIGPFCASGGSGNCAGVGCHDPGDDSGNGNDDACRKKQTASYCGATCSAVTYPGSITTKCGAADWTRTVTACAATGSTTTTSKTLTCPVPTYKPEDPNQIIDDGYDGDDLGGGMLIDSG